MIEKIKKLFENSVVRYIFAGGTSYAIELSTILLLKIVFKFSSIEAVAISFWIGLITSFLLQKLFAFNNNDKTVKKISWQTVSYLLLVLFNYGFTLGFIYAFGLIDVIITRTIALIITTFWNYFIYQRIIFKK